MKRSTKLIMVYAELRRALGDTVSAGEVLQAAERLTDLADFREVIDRCGTADVFTPGCVPLDRAFQDGGWALLHDGYLSGLLGDCEPTDYSWRRGSLGAGMMENWA